MINETKIREEAIELRKAKEFEKALPLFKELWDNLQPKNKWDGWGYVVCLNSLKNYSEAYRVAKEVILLYADFDYIISPFVFSSYMANIKDYPTDGDQNKLLEFVEEIITVAKNKKDDLFYNKSVLYLMQYYSEKGKFKSVLQYAQHIDKKSLASDSFKGITADGKKFVKPSDRESYYLKISKAMVRTEKYGDCIEICQEAANLFPQSVWFKWHMGVSLGKLNKHKEALKVLEPISLIKKEWFILKDISAIYYRIKSYDMAFKKFIEACNVSIRMPSPWNRWELYYLGSRILLKQGKKDIAQKHTALVYKLKEGQSWRVDEYLASEVQAEKIDIRSSYDDLYKELDMYWKEEGSKNKEYYTGIIKKILPNGKSGFIKSDQGTDYYFIFKNIVNKQKVSENDKARFSIQKSYDKAKNKETWEAVDISIRMF
jgi:tetratricopeptide (TPR) repeat protein